MTWWAKLWTSPMATEYLEVDFEDLVELAKLRDDLAKVRDPMKRPKLMTEIRIQGQRFGLSPLDRRRLQWEIDKGEEAQERTTTRAARRTRTRSTTTDDPRALLKAVK